MSARGTPSQIAASDPTRSSWVSAHAGSGKTTVLAQRVIRLLLRGVPPGRILCLTYTRVAAANMAQKALDQMSAWTRLDDARLAAELRTLEGDGDAAPIDAGHLRAARRLFAAAIDTPGGLKIQTLHAFCERLLHAFPFEAEVPANFTVLEEADASLLLEESLERALGGAWRDPELGEAIARLSAETSGARIATAARALVSERAVLASHPDVRSFEQEARAQFGLGASRDKAAIFADLFGGPEGAARRRAWRAALGEGGANDQKAAAKLGDAEAAMADLSAAAEKLFAVFLSEGRPRKKVATSKIDAVVALALQDEAERVKILRDELSDVATIARSVALFRLAKAVAESYRRTKERDGALDFADLTSFARKLLERESAAWVLYKLDSGIDHILVDEAQDTSADQWKIVEALSKDWLSGAGRGGHRTLFAVGDEKQSIFSFNGARPELLDANRRFYERRHEGAERPFKPVSLDISFRSAPIVLEAVDRVIGQLPVWLNLIDAGDNAEAFPAPVHTPAKRDPAGRVELWPVLTHAKAKAPLDWLEREGGAGESGPVALARRIAKVVAGWLSPGSKERIGAPPRPIRPGDILILVRKRGALFEAINRAMKLAGVATAGADRIELQNSVAPNDLAALGRALLTPDDDLNLAIALKSPLFGFDDDDLIALAPARSGTLLDALSTSINPRHRAAAQTLERWTARAAMSAPFEFYAWVLGEEGARRDFLARLGPEANDAIDEFLALAIEMEARGAPALQNFLDAVQSSGGSIKRDLEEAGDLLRVMTVHAAKGLEAPIVILPDTTGGEGAPAGPGNAPKILFPAPAHEQAPHIALWPGKKEANSPRLGDIERRCAQVALGEHRRLLYVAMTRAAERLIVCGFAGAQTAPNGTWHAFVEMGLRDILTDEPAPWNPEEKIRALGAVSRSDTPAIQSSPSAAALPDWMRIPPSQEIMPRAKRASSEAFGRGEGARARGRYFHFLLERLAKSPASMRLVSAQHVLGRPFGLDEAEVAPLRDKALAMLASSSLAPFFAPGSMGEVAILSRGAGAMDVRVDRLTRVGDEIWIADFKLGAPPSSVPAAYVEQLAHYRAALARLHPGKMIRAFLLWSDADAPHEIARGELEVAALRIGLGASP